jgi:hypothetical protein
VNLFLDGIFDEHYSSPNKVMLLFSEWTGTANVPRLLYGLLATEPTMRTQNKWGPILENVSMLADASSLMGSQSMFSWVGASTMCWKGTEPLSINLDFLLINYREKLYLEESLKALIKLTALAEIKVDNVLGNVTVAVHGGYAADVLTNNRDMFAGKNFVDTAKSNLSDQQINQFVSKVNNELQTAGYFFPRFAGAGFNGTLTVQIGNKLKISNMLVTSIDVAPSMEEVETGKALYYRVNLSLRGARPLLTTDVDKMY